MSARSSERCLTFCTAIEDRSSQYEVQWQFPKFTVTCTSVDLGFTKAILAFVAETRDNPECRDSPIGDGVYRRMGEKSIDLSHYFLGIRLRFQKLGESDQSYLLQYDCGDKMSLAVELCTPELIDSFVDGINEIVDDYVGTAET